MKYSSTKYTTLVAEYNCGATLHELAARYGRNYTSIRSALLLRGATLRPAVTPPRKAYDTLLADFNAGATVRELCIKYDRDDTSIRGALRRRGIHSTRRATVDA